MNSAILVYIRTNNILAVSSWFPSFKPNFNAGDVAQVCRQAQSLLTHPRALLIQDVFSVLKKIR